MEMLLRYINQLADINLWDPISVTSKGPYFTHLLFADDLNLMGKVNKKTVALFLVASPTSASFQDKISII